MYIVNILIFTKVDYDHHLECIERVLQLLQDHELHVHLEKTFLSKEEVEYLGYMLMKEGIKSHTSKIIPIMNLKEPKTMKKLKSFLGFVNYYKKLWNHWSHMLEPLTKLTLKGSNNIKLMGK